MLVNGSNRTCKQFKDTLIVSWNTNETRNTLPVVPPLLRYVRGTRDVTQELSKGELTKAETQRLVRLYQT